MGLAEHPGKPGPAEPYRARYPLYDARSAEEKEILLPPPVTHASLHSGTPPRPLSPFLRRQSDADGLSPIAGFQTRCGRKYSPSSYPLTSMLGFLG